MSRASGDSGQFQFTCGPYTVIGVPDGLPVAYAAFKGKARLVEEFALSEPDLCCLVVLRADLETPLLVVAQSFSPAGCGFEPGVLLVHETNRLFIGAGERLLAYDLGGPARLWEDAADTGFWGWARHGETVLMSAELELAAWDLAGRKLWTTFVEPPWSHRVEAGTVHLDVMGTKSDFPLLSGPRR